LQWWSLNKLGVGFASKSGESELYLPFNVLLLAIAFFFAAHLACKLVRRHTRTFATSQIRQLSNSSFAIEALPCSPTPSQDPSPVKIPHKPPVFFV
jgi:hypothetical protein